MLTNYEKRMVGYLLEHPAAEESVHLLAMQHGFDNLQIHVLDATNDQAVLAMLPEASAGDVLWHAPQHAGIVKQDGAILPESERP